MLLCSTLCEPMRYSPPSTSVHRISRQDYWSELPFTSPRDFSYSEIKPGSPTFLPVLGSLWKPNIHMYIYIHIIYIYIYIIYIYIQVAQLVKESTCDAKASGDVGSFPGWGRSSGIRAWRPTPIFLPGEFHGQRSSAGYSPQGCKEQDMTEATQHRCIRILLRHKKG